MRKSPRSKLDSIRITRGLLEESPVPNPSSDDDKDARGRVLVVGGCVTLPGAVVLAGIAALRAGAGKLQIATCRSIAPLVGITVPEALSLGLD
jgi:NAD(P)H-hydrate repair Nnr-like enzyme with NAD(P)H-hydrate dehydratase domain